MKRFQIYLLFILIGINGLWLGTQMENKGLMIASLGILLGVALNYAVHKIVQ